MTKLGWSIAIVLALMVAGGAAAAYFLTREQSAAPIAPTTEQAPTTDTAPTTTEGIAIAVSATGETTTTVTYTDSGFAPAKVFVRTGDTVEFVNSSTHTMWVGVDDHPSHTKYDGTSTREHCAEGKNLNGSFDQCVAGAPGTTYRYTFTKSGTFDYHNHTASKHSGSVVVE